MKKLMIMGGFLGFLTGLIFSSAALGPANPMVLFRASIGAVTGGLLLRWWGRLWVRSIMFAQRERLAAEAAENSLETSPLNQH
jgi:hypothetical protein